MRGLVRGFGRRGGRALAPRRVAAASLAGSRRAGSRMQQVLIGVIASSRLVPKTPANRFAPAHHSCADARSRFVDATAHLALQQHGQLMPQRSILASSRLLDHRRQREAILSSDQYRQGFRHARVSSRELLGALGCSLVHEPRRRANESARIGPEAATTVNEVKVATKVREMQRRKPHNAIETNAC